MKYISYIIAGFMTIAMMLVFVNMGEWMQMVAKLPFMKVDPWISGGEVTDSIVGDDYKIMIHEEVHQGLFTEDGDGYVQLDVSGCYDGSLAVGGSSYILNADSMHVILLEAQTGEEVAVRKCQSDGVWIRRVGL